MYFVNSLLCTKKLNLITGFRFLMKGNMHSMHREKTIDLIAE